MKWNLLVMIIFLVYLYLPGLFIDDWCYCSWILWVIWLLVTTSCTVRTTWISSGTSSNSTTLWTTHVTAFTMKSICQILIISLDFNFYNNFIHLIVYVYIQLFIFVFNSDLLWYNTELICWFSKFSLWIKIISYNFNL